MRGSVVRSYERCVLEWLDSKWKLERKFKLAQW